MGGLVQCVKAIRLPEAPEMPEFPSLPTVHEPQSFTDNLQGLVDPENLASNVFDGVTGQLEDRQLPAFFGMQKNVQNQNHVNVYQGRAVRPFVQAYPVVSPTYIAYQAPTVYENPVEPLRAMTFRSAPSFYSAQDNKVRSPTGYPKVPSMRPRSSGGFCNGILRKASDVRVEGSLLGKTIDAEIWSEVGSRD